MAYCSNCGEEVSEEAAFCEACGADLSSDLSDSNDSDESDTTASTSTDTESSVDETTDEGINWKRVGKAIVIALLPAIAAYMLVSIAANEVLGVVFIVALALFAYLLYQYQTTKGMLGGMCFWLAIEAFLAPVAMLIYTFVYASEETSSAAGEAGAALGGTFLTIVAFVVGIPLGIVLYLVSGRLEPSE